jgi:putative N-acetylmannosamine-6-phosphate epimerase
VNIRTPSVIESIGSGALVVSCQPVIGGPLDTDDIVVAMARAAEIGGAKAVRIEGVARVHKVKQAAKIPVIGIVKRSDQPLVYITPLLEDMRALANAGADIVAFDATHRPRSVSVADLVTFGKSLGLTLMADCSSMKEAEAAFKLGCEIIGSTLSGYVGGPVPEYPDFELIAQMAQRGMRVMAEGRIHTPELARQALECGAWAVTVGTALTRLEVTTSWFSKAMS